MADLVTRLCIRAQPTGPLICATAGPDLKGNNTMVRRSLAVIGLAFAALLLLAPAASAQYVDPGIITVDDPNPDVGDSITVTGTACGDAQRHGDHQPHPGRPDRRRRPDHDRS